MKKSRKIIDLEDLAQDFWVKYLKPAIKEKYGWDWENKDITQSGLFFAIRKKIKYKAQWSVMRHIRPFILASTDERTQYSRLRSISETSENTMKSVCFKKKYNKEKIEDPKSYSKYAFKTFTSQLLTETLARSPTVTEILWLASDSKIPSLEHKRLYGKKTKDPEGFEVVARITNRKRKMLPGEDINCRCIMKINRLGEKPMLALEKQVKK